MILKTFIYLYLTFIKYNDLNHYIFIHLYIFEFIYIDDYQLSFSVQIFFKPKYKRFFYSIFTTEFDIQHTLLISILMIQPKPHLFITTPIIITLNFLYLLPFNALVKKSDIISSVPVNTNSTSPLFTYS